jgi:hypothetical protein
MPIIRPHTPVITQINVFTVPPDRQQPLIDHLARRRQRGVRHGAPGLYEVVHALERTG